MDWLTDFLIWVAIGYIVSRLDRLVEQGAEARKESAEVALTQSRLASLRDRIFNLKQAAERVLSQDGTPDKVTTAAISIIESRLHNLDITPALFPDLNDKGYVLSTTRLISANKRRLLERLSPDEQAEVARMTAMGVRLLDYDYYLENYSSGYRLMEAADTVANTRLGPLLELGFVSIAIAGLLLLGLVVIVGDSTGGFIAFLLGFCVWIGTLITWLRGYKYRSAKQLLGESSDKLDLVRFAALHKEVAEGGLALQRLQETARGDLAAFFGDAELLSCVEQLRTSK